VAFRPDAANPQWVSEKTHYAGCQKTRVLATSRQRHRHQGNPPATRLSAAERQKGVMSRLGVLTEFASPVKAVRCASL
jgi:hypothetical protein